VVSSLVAVYPAITICILWRRPGEKPLILHIPGGLLHDHICLLCTEFFIPPTVGSVGSVGIVGRGSVSIVGIGNIFEM
jgi:hypothetical protein